MTVSSRVRVCYGIGVYAMARGLWAYAAKIGVLSVYVADQCESRRYQYTDNIRRKIAASDTFYVVQIEFETALLQTSSR
jgi:hypothetical protein